MWFTKFLYPANERRTHVLTFKDPDVHDTRKEEQGIISSTRKRGESFSQSHICMYSYSCCRIIIDGRSEIDFSCGA
jgi:hypothetical protein